MDTNSLVSTVFLFGTLISICRSACPTGYTQMYGGATTPEAVGASCCKFVAFDPATQDYPSIASSCPESGFLHSTRFSGELVAAATCGFGNGVTANTEGFFIGLEKFGSSSFRYQKSLSTIDTFSALPYTDLPTPLGASFGLFTDVVIIRKNTDTPPAVVQNFMKTADDVLYNVKGYVCEANYTGGTFSRMIGTAESCNCPSGYYHAGQSCVKPIDVAAPDSENWFKARVACKADNPKADLLSPINNFEQQSVALGHTIAGAENKARWLGYQDLYMEAGVVANPDVTRTAAAGFNLMSGDTPSKDFAMSYFHQWTMNDAFGTEDNTNDIAGGMCQIYVNPTECASKFTAADTSVSFVPNGCVRTYIMRENRNDPGAALISGVTTAEACYDEIKNEAKRGSRCMTQFYREFNQCWSFTTCTDIITEATPDILSPGIVAFQHFNSAECPSSTTCDALPPQIIPKYKVVNSMSVVADTPGAGTGSSADCWARCQAQPTCKTSTWCPGATAALNTCVLHQETMALFNNKNAPRNTPHAYHKVDGCEIQRKVTCEEGKAAASAAMASCPGTFTPVSDPADPASGATRCLKVVSGAFTTYGAAYKACMMEASTISKVGSVGTPFSAMAAYDALWAAASLTAGTSKIWTGACSDGKTGATGFKTADYKDTALASGLTASGAQCTTAVNSAALAAQAVTGCTDCLGVLCQLYDPSIMPNP